MLGTPACVMNRCIGQHGFLVSRAWWKETAITRVSSCGLLEMNLGTEQCTIRLLNGSDHQMPLDLCITKVQCFMPDGLTEVELQQMSCAPCTHLLPTLFSTDSQAKVTDHSSCASTAMQWVTQTGR